MNREIYNVRVTPQGSMDVLSRAEVENLLGTSQGKLYDIYRR